MKINLTKKEKIIILALLGVLIIIMAGVFLINKKSANKQINNNSSTVLKPVFLDNAEKGNLNIKSDTKVQVIKRSPDGQIMLYKVINNDSDIITDSNQIVPEATHAKN